MGPLLQHTREVHPAGLWAELIVQNGRLKGTHRRLEAAATFIGKAAACDIRLNVVGVSSMHCLLMLTPSELQLRDLDSRTGTLVNGRRISTCLLSDGDVMTVGPFQFQVQIRREPTTAAALPKPVLRPTKEDSAAQDRAAQRIQVAAVVAQQAALNEWEQRLAQREATLEKQQAQVSAHLEEKRQRLMELHTNTQAAREALLHDKQDYERHVEQITANLGKTERDLLTKSQHNDANKKRLIRLRGRLIRRFRRERAREQERQAKQAADLDSAAVHIEQEHARLQQRKDEFARNCLKYNSEMELGRRRLQDECDRFRQEQKQVCDQLQNKFAAIEEREGRLVLAEKILARERHQLRRRVKNLRAEAHGLENRLRSGRRLLADLQHEIRTTEEQQKRSPQQSGDELPPAVAPHLYPLALLWPKAWHIESWLRPAAPVSAPRPVESEAELLFRQQMLELTILTGDLADQQAVLVEQLECVVQIQAGWEQERQALAAQMASILGALQTAAHTIQAREQEVTTAMEEVQTRHQELLRLREHLVGWQGQLRTMEIDLVARSEQQQTALAAREQALQQQAAALAELSRRWAELRKQEAQACHASQEVSDRASEEYVALNQERRQMLRKLEEERRTLTSKALAVEQFRQECLTKASDVSAAERRMELLQRRWSVEELEALRLSKRECDGLQEEVTSLRTHNEELRQQLNRLQVEQQSLVTERDQWEQQRLRSNLTDMQLREQLNGTIRQRDQLERHLAELRREMERIAEQLMETAPAPAVLRHLPSAGDSPIVISRAA
jgi:hypothetical protein